MLKQRRIIHPRYYSNQPSIYIQRAEIQRAIERQMLSGEVVNEWVPVLDNLPCVFSNLAGLGTPERKENRTPDHTEVQENFHLSFTNIYTYIQLGMRVIVSEPDKNVPPTIYNIVGIDHDSQSSVTRLRLEKVSV